MCTHDLQPCCHLPLQLTLVVLLLYQPGIYYFAHIQIRTFCNLHCVVVVVYIYGGCVWCGVMCGVGWSGMQDCVLVVYVVKVSAVWGGTGKYFLSTCSVINVWCGVWLALRVNQWCVCMCGASAKLFKQHAFKPLFCVQRLQWLRVHKSPTDFFGDFFFGLATVNSRLCIQPSRGLHP